MKIVRLYYVPYNLWLAVLFINYRTRKPLISVTQMHQVINEQRLQKKLLNIATKGKLYYLILISLYSFTNSIVTVTKYKLFLKKLKVAKN